MVRVKICGNTDAEQVRLCVESGADCVGFVVEYPVSVPWNLSREQARGLVSLVPPMVTRAVVTGGGPEKVLALRDCCCLTLSSCTPTTPFLKRQRLPGSWPRWESA